MRHVFDVVFDVVRVRVVTARSRGTERFPESLSSRAARRAGGERRAHRHRRQFNEPLAEDGAPELGVEVQRARARLRVQPAVQRQRHDVDAHARGKGDAEHPRGATAHRGALERSHVETQAQRVRVLRVGGLDHAERRRAGRVVVEVRPRRDAQRGARRRHRRQRDAVAGASRVPTLRHGPAPRWRFSRNLGVGARRRGDAAPPGLARRGKPTRRRRGDARAGRRRERHVGL
mmetsp:Transcript_9511/g.40362  ORF Transcript_9511/g.40362 Transcript_9511/m.40362 type:complete len:232 (+) Transcript_9511:529-1224(+)